MRLTGYVTSSLLWLSGSMAQNAVTPFLPQSFFFDWNKPGQPLPIPITEQCENIHITWSRSAATGPNPTAPYFLQVYTSVYLTPFTIPVGDVLSYDWAVPFAPGTQYQICMFDKFGHTGGCQDTYTVIPSSSTPTCSNITFPPLLGVSAIVDNGPMSQYGWVDQCTDISLTPTNGTPPFTLTVAPALHPPYNITVNEMKAINWTVSLDWASPFFISLIDGNGAGWANGPLHSGGGGTIRCLAGNTTTIAANKVNMPVAIGAGIGGLGIGAILGILSAYLVLKRRLKRKSDESRFVDMGRSNSQYIPVPTTSSAGVNYSLPMSSPSTLQHRLTSSQGYQVEPFVMPDEEGLVSNDIHSPSSAYSPAVRVTSMHEPPSPAPRPNQSHVYVLHHDSNVPPVTIYHQEGTEIVELPPRYPPQSETLSEPRSASDAARSDPPTGSEQLALHQTRQPNKVGKPTRPPKP